MPSGKAILGEWRIAGNKGRSVDQAEAMTASILLEENHAAAGCGRWNWGYRLTNGTVKVERRLSVSPPCPRPLTRAESDLQEAMLGVDSAVRRPDGSLVLAR